jgi:transglutaminase-like putative cysteine protease
VSTGAQVAVLDARGVRRTRERSELLPVERPRIRLVAFGGLALYGALRWGTLLSPAPTWRMLGLFAVAALIAGAGPALRSHSRPLAILAAAIAIIAIFPLAGIPLSWVRHVRIAVTADHISQGLSALPRALVPYNGINEGVRLVIVLGAGVLLIDAALMVAFAPRPIGELRRAGAALPLVVLAVVPSTLSRPSLAYLHGLILFALLAAFVWGERVPRYDVPLAVGIAVLAGAAGMIAAPALDEHTPWLNYEALAGTLTLGHVESFDWSQRYGPINWPRTGREVLEVQARRADYWKAQDLDLFNGTGWTQGYVQPASQQPPAPDPSIVPQWTQTITVSLRSMRTSDVIGAGFAARPDHLQNQVTGGYSPGTWITGADLQPGDSYTISTYSPRPTPAQLGADVSTPPDELLGGYRSMLLPAGTGSFAPPEVRFPPFHSGLVAQSISGIYGGDGNQLVRHSPYARAYALAERLARHSSTPYGFVRSVMRYLARGYTYSENPPPSTFPLETFLFNDKVGYCQQFAGAMALLLRMGGVPARVAAGFTSGSLDRGTNRYVVTDVDAHAWVEAWFPHYGWVRFDPTPGAAPARGGHTSLLPALKGPATGATPVAPVRKPDPTPVTRPTNARTHSGGTSGWLIAPLIAVPLAVLALALRATARRREPRAEELVTELERALARSGRPAASGVTLAALEHRYRDSPGAVGYIRAIRTMRFGGGSRLPTKAQRNALRAQLCAGLGLTGRLRALWALPPRWTPAWRASSRGIKS